IVVRVVARGIGWHVEEIRSQWASRHDTVVWNVRQLRFTQILQRDNVTKVVVGLLYAVLTVRHPNLDARNLNAAIDERIVRQRLIVLVAEVLREEEMAIGVIVESEEFEILNSSASLCSYTSSLRFLFRENTSNCCASELQLCFHTEKALHTA